MIGVVTRQNILKDMVGTWGSTEQRRQERLQEHVAKRKGRIGYH